jgi:hypothetical protein
MLNLLYYYRIFLILEICYIRKKHCRCKTTYIDVWWFLVKLHSNSMTSEFDYEQESFCKVAVSPKHEFYIPIFGQQSCISIGFLNCVIQVSMIYRFVVHLNQID